MKLIIISCLVLLASNVAMALGVNPGGPACGCCWPAPKSCCEETTTAPPTTTPPTTTPPTTTPPTTTPPTTTPPTTTPPTTTPPTTTPPTTTPPTTTPPTTTPPTTTPPTTTPPTTTPPTTTPPTTTPPTTTPPTTTPPTTTPPTTTPPTTTPSTTTDDDTCPCTDSDLMITLDRSGEMGLAEFNNMITFTNGLLALYAAPDCSRTAVVTYSDTSNIIYNLGHPAATDDAIGIPLVNAIPNPAGTDNGLGIFRALDVIAQDLSGSENCKVVLLISNGGTFSAAQSLTIFHAKTLKNKNARLCIIGMENPGESAGDKNDRIDWFNDLLAESDSTSELLADTDAFSTGALGSLYDAVQDCVCKECVNEGCSFCG